MAKRSKKEIISLLQRINLKTIAEASGSDEFVGDIIEHLGSQLEPPVMPMLTEIEVNSGWEAWLNNSFKYYKKDFSDKLRKSNKRSGVIETPKKWIENYYKELLEVTERYLNASKHSA